MDESNREGAEGRGSGRPKVYFPPTWELERIIRDHGYTKWWKLCNDMGWKQPTLSNALRDRGDREYLNGVIEETREEIARRAVEEAYELASPPGYEADEVVYWTDEEVQEILKPERQRAAKLARENARLEFRLRDREWERNTMMDAARTAMADYKATFDAVGLWTPSEEYGVNGDGWYCHAPTADIHAGKYVWGQEAWGEDYDTDTAAQRIVDHAHAVVDFIRSQPGECIGCHMTDLGDLFHGLDSKTEGGTLLHQDTRAVRVYTKTLAAKREAFEIVRAEVPRIWGYFARGNHDHIWNMSFHTNMGAFYEHAEDVEIEVPTTKWAWFTVGSDQAYSLHYLDHGKGINDTFTAASREKLSDSIAEGVPSEVVSGAKAIYIYLGHLHHHAVLEKGNREIIRLPSMAETDDYETDHRFGGRPSAIMYRLDGVGCIDLTKRIYF